MDRGTLTLNGLLFLADQGHFFEPSETIADKSNANLLAKCLVSLQVLWVAGQTIERKIAGFPISLLEFHTLVHVFCASVMYLLWLQKPYDIGEPTTISSEESEAAIAFIVSSSRWPGSSGFLTQSIDPRDRQVDRFYRRKDPRFLFYGDMIDSHRERLRSINPATEIPLHNTDDPRITTHLFGVNADLQHLHGDPPLQDNDNSEVVSEANVRFSAKKIVRCYHPLQVAKAAVILSCGQALASGVGPVDYYGIQVGLSPKDVYRLDIAGTLITAILRSREAPRKPDGEGDNHRRDRPLDPFDLASLIDGNSH